MWTANRLRLETTRDLLEFDERTLALASFRSKSAPDQEFIAADPMRPAFVVQYLDNQRQLRQISSLEASGVSVTVPPGEATGGATLVSAEFDALGGLNLSAVMTVSTRADDECSHWALTLRNSAGLFITDMQFPFVVVAYQLTGRPGSECLVQPLNTGKLIRAPQPHQLTPDHPRNWQFYSDRGDANHYPGLTFAQFLAYYNDRAGLFISSRDPAGRPKLIQPTHRGPGMRLGFAHVVGEVTPEHFELGYDVVVTSFRGDWYTAAELYRSWALEQPWAQQSLARRTDVPQWLLESPVLINVRAQGRLDVGPSERNDKFVPFAKAIPLLDECARQLESPVAPMLAAWERPGPWVYPDCFPPVGGMSALQTFAAEVKSRGWHLGAYCNGTRWVTMHFWSGYDGTDYFRERNGAACVCREFNGEPWRESWDRSWRPSYACCLGVEQTHELAHEYVKTLIDAGVECIQFLQQNSGAATFPCYATDHAHPPAPGPWMTDAMARLLRRLAGLVPEESASSSRNFALAVEHPPNEWVLPLLQLYDVRLTVPGLTSGGGDGQCIPLHQFLFHEFALSQGSFAFGPVSNYMHISAAYACVMGELLSCTLDPGESLLLSVRPWPPGAVPPGDQPGAVQLLRNAAALRRGPARDFLVYGRMLRPAEVQGLREHRWYEGLTELTAPAVWHSAWRAPDGQIGVVLANWTHEANAVAIIDARLGAQVVLTTSERGAEDLDAGLAGIEVSVPPLGWALLSTVSAK